MWLSQAKLLEVHAAALAARLDRSALLSGIHRGFVASLRTAPSPSEQLLLDLSAMNAEDELTDGSVPLRDWLGNAVALAGPRKESRVLAEALQLVTRPAAPSRAAPPTASFEAAPVQASAPGTAAAPGHGRRTARVFLSVAPEDERFAIALSKHLAGLVRQGAITVSYFKDTPPGANVAAWIQAEMDRADVVVLLVSPDSVAGLSTYAEMERALKLRDARGTRVVPVLVRSVDLGPTPLAGVTCLPRSTTPVASAGDPDKVYAEIASDLGGIVAALGQPATAS